MFRFVLLLLFTSWCLVSSCTDKTETEGPCTVKLHVCTNTYDWQVVYISTATDLKSGMQAGNTPGTHHHSSTGSAEDANWNLYNSMIVAPSNSTSNATNPCNCFTSVEELGPKCILQVSVCFYFLSVNDMLAGTPAYRAWTFDEQTSMTGFSDNGAGHNATQAVVDSLTDLAKQEPNILVRCPPPSLDFYQRMLQAQGFY